MSNLLGIKVGDFVMRRPVRERNHPTFYRITKVSEKRAYAGEFISFRLSDGWSYGVAGGFVERPTPGELAAKETRENEIRHKRDEQMAYESREDYKLASRLSSTDTEVWMLLPIEALRGIARQLDDAKHVKGASNV